MIEEKKEEIADTDTNTDLVEDTGNVEIYEVGYHLLPSISEEDVPSEVAQIHSIISKLGGNIISEAMPVIRQLAYDIKKKVDNRGLNFNKAYFGWVKFEMDSSRAIEFKNELDNLKTLLRFIIVKTVRENTLYTPKVPVFRKEAAKELPAEGEVPVEKAPVSEEEIDKSIDELVIN